MNLTLAVLFSMGAVCTATSQIVLNEVLYDPAGSDTGGERIELRNLGGGSADLTGFDLYADAAGYYTFPSFTLAGGGFVVIHLRESGSDTGSDLYYASAPGNMGNASGSAALFNSSTHDNTTLLSFVQWGAGNKTWAGTAVTLGLWSLATDFVPQVAEGHSMEYDGSGNAPGDWFDQSTPSLGGDNILPVQMSSLLVEVEGDDVVVTWKTVSEVDNIGFDVERRLIGGMESHENKGKGRWVMVGFCRGFGTSSTPHEYIHMDRGIKNGRYGYRVCQRDVQGVKRYSGEVEIDVKNVPPTATLLETFPNPFNPTTTISYTVSSPVPVRLSIVDILGREVAVLVERDQETGEYAVRWDASRESAGVYFSRLAAGAQVITRKIVLLK